MTSWEGGSALFPPGNPPEKGVLEAHKSSGSPDDGAEACVNLGLGREGAEGAAGVGICSPQAGRAWEGRWLGRKRGSPHDRMQEEGGEGRINPDIPCAPTVCQTRFRALGTRSGAQRVSRCAAAGRGVTPNLNKWL